MNNILFKHERTDAWGMHSSIITVIDSKDDNLIIDNTKYTIPTEDINKVKELLENDKLYEDKELLFPPVLDGTFHKIEMSGVKTKEIKGFNLWFWNGVSSFNNVEKDINKIEYTKLIIELIREIQIILKVNNIKYSILGH